MPTAEPLLDFTHQDEDYDLYDMGSPYRDAAKLHHFVSNDLIKASRYLPPEDDTFRGIRPALRTLSTSRCLPVYRKLLDAIPDDGWGEKALVQWDQWDAQGENVVLLTLSALCRTGVMAQSEGRWVATRFGERVKYEWKWETPLASTRLFWTNGIKKEYLNSLSWAWEALHPSDSRKFLSTVVKDPAGLYPAKLPFVQSHNFTLKLIAAAAALGAVWFTGWRWEPTVYGLWLANHPESPLRAET